jgi:death-on-curing protein
MRYLSLVEVLELHEVVIDISGGSRGNRDIGALESAVNQPRVTFDKSDLYPDVVSKAAALCFSLIMNHPFIDGNKRVGHERIILDLAAGQMKRDAFIAWLNNHITKA